MCPSIVHLHEVHDLCYKEPGTHCLHMLQIVPEFWCEWELLFTFVIRATQAYVIAYWYCGSCFRMSVGLFIVSSANYISNTVQARQ